MIKKIKLYYINRKIHKLTKSINNITDIIDNLCSHLHDYDLTQIMDSIAHYKRVLACDIELLNSYKQDKERLER